MKLRNLGLILVFMLITYSHENGLSASDAKLVEDSPAPAHKINQAINIFPNEVSVHIFRYLPAKVMPLLELVSSGFQELCQDSHLRQLNARTCYITSKEKEKKQQHKKGIPYINKRLFYMKLSAYFGSETAITTLASWYKGKFVGLNTPTARRSLPLFFINLARKGDETALCELESWAASSSIESDFFLFDVSIREKFIEVLSRLGSNNQPKCLQILAEWYTVNCKAFWPQDRL